jgi:glycosyltransferase involved in cell wall biosynthesis
LVASLLPKQEILFQANTGAKRILVIDWKPPTPDRDSGSYRMSRILFCLRDAGLEVDFIGDRPAEGPQYAEQLENRRINVIIGREAAIRHLAELGADFKLALLARPEVFERYAPVVRAFAPNARILYDTVDLHWVRIARSVANASSPVEAESLRERSRRYKRIELANARSADITLAISEEEKRTILEEEPGLDVRTLPNIHEIANWRVPFVERRDLFFIGGFDHEPNVDAVRYFVAEVMPLVTRLLPEARFHIVGSNMPPIIRDLASSQVVPVGYVEDVEPYFAQSRLFVAPLRHGAGMKGKVGQSLSFGLPVVTTPIGAEGIGLVDGESALIRDDAEGLAAAIAGLYTDEALWNRLAENGRELIRQRFSVEAVRVQLLALVNG